MPSIVLFYVLVPSMGLGDFQYDDNPLSITKAFHQEPDCLFPAIGKMSGCITTVILPPGHSGLVGGGNVMYQIIKMAKNGYNG